jgi:hypothetical protein
LTLFCQRLLFHSMRPMVAERSTNGHNYLTE